MFPECLSESTISSLTIVSYAQPSPCLSHMLFYSPSLSLSFSLLWSLPPDPTLYLVTIVCNVTKGAWMAVLKGLMLQRGHNDMTTMYSTVTWLGVFEDWLEPERGCGSQLQYWLAYLYWGSLISSGHYHSLCRMGGQSWCATRVGEGFCSFLPYQLAHVAQFRFIGSGQVNWVESLRERDVLETYIATPKTSRPFIFCFLY